MKLSWGVALAVALLLVFVIVGASFIPVFGPQEDESLFTPVALQGPCGQAPGISIAGTHVPLMLMSYVGALKGWLYKILFTVWAPSVWSLRLPALLIAAAAILVTWRVLSLAAGPVAGVVAAALLATDATYLITSVFDWGPVAIQHFLFASAAFFFLRFQKSAKAVDAFASAFCVGLLLWNKTISVWFLAGTGAALLACWFRLLGGWLKPRPAMAAVAGLVLGMAPLLVFNAVENWPTIRENAAMEKPDYASKANMVRITLDGSVMFGYLFAEASGPESLAHGIRSSWLPYLFLAAIPAGLAVATRQTLFLLAAIVLSWIFMISSRGGGAAHHAVLLAPAPHALIAIVAARIIGSRQRLWRVAAIAACTATVVSGLLVLQRYRLAARISTGGPGWTNALLELGRELRRYPDRWVIVTDWGMNNNLCFLAPEVHFAPIDPAPEPMTHAIVNADALAVRPLGDQRFFPESAEKLIAHAAKLGKRMRVVATIRDTRGEPKFEILEFD